VYATADVVVILLTMTTYNHLVTCRPFLGITTSTVGSPWWGGVPGKRSPGVCPPWDDGPVAAATLTTASSTTMICKQYDNDSIEMYETQHRTLIEIAQQLENITQLWQRPLSTYDKDTLSRRYATLNHLYSFQTTTHKSCLRVLFSVTFISILSPAMPIKTA